MEQFKAWIRAGAAGVLMLLAAGCGGGGGSAPQPESPAAVAGAWIGAWVSTGTSLQGTVWTELAQNGTAATGTFIMTGSPCFASGTLSATVSGTTIIVSAVSGVNTLRMEGTVADGTIAGNYSVSSGTCAGDLGSFALSREANGSETNATLLLSGLPSPRYMEADQGTLYCSDRSDAPVKRVSGEGNVSALIGAFGDPESMIVGQEGNLYWIGDGAVASQSCTGEGRTLVRTDADGNASALLASGENCAYGTNALVESGSELVWVTSTASPESYTIESVSKNGGGKRLLYTTATPITSLAGDENNLYWLEGSFPDAGRIKTMPLAGGTASTLLEGAGTYNAFVGNIAVSGSALYVAEVLYPYPGQAKLLAVDLNGSGVTEVGTIPALPTMLTADATNLYWIDDSALRKMPQGGGSVVTLADGLASPVYVTYDAQNLYWVESVCCAHGQTGRIRKIPASGGTAETLIDGVNAPQSVVPDGTLLYWIEGGAIGRTEGFGRIARLAGSAAQTIAGGIVGGPMPIALDDTYVYMADRWTVKKVPKTGGIAENLAIASFAIHDIAATGGSVYWIEAGPYATVAGVPREGGTATVLSNIFSGPAGKLMQSGGYLYWSAHDDTVARVPLAGGATQTVAAGLPFLSDFTTDGTEVYFSEQDTGKIRKTPVGGGSITELAALKPLTWRILAADALNLYWIDQTTMGYVPKTGGTAALIRSGVDSDALIPNSLVPEGGYLYWTETGSGSLYRSAEP